MTMWWIFHVPRFCRVY